MLKPDDEDQVSNGYVYSESSCSKCRQEVENCQSYSFSDDEYQPSESPSEDIPVRKVIFALPYNNLDKTLQSLKQEMVELYLKNRQKDETIKRLMANLDKNNAGVHPINSLQVISQVDDGQTNQLMFGRSNRNIGQLTSSPRSMFSLYSSPQLCVPLTTISPRGFNKSRSKSKSKYMPVFPGEDEITQMKLQIARLEKYARDFQIESLQLRSKLSAHEDNIEWMRKFIDSFNRMSESLSNNYGQPLSIKGYPLRRRTKLCWRFLKDLIKELVKS